MLNSLFNIDASLKACNFIKSRLRLRCFPCEYCEIFKNTCFYRTPSVAALMETSNFRNRILTGQNPGMVTCIPKQLLFCFANTALGFSISTFT